MMHSKDSIIPISDLFPCEIMDEILSNIENFTQTKDSHRGWLFSGATAQNSIDKTFWNRPLDDDKFYTEYIFEKVKSIIKVNFNEEVELSRVYLNGATFGQQGYLHQDFWDDFGRTFLIYCNDNWNIEWAGGTVFVRDGGGYETVYPQYNSAVYFDGKIKHFSQPLSRDFYGFRVTLAYKLFVECND